MLSVRDALEVLSAQFRGSLNQKGKTMATDKRTSEQGTAFARAIVRNFLLTALEHEAVTDRVNELLLDHSRRSEEGYSVDAEDFKRLLAEVLSAAWYIDWEWVAQTLKTTRDDGTASTDQSSDTPEAIDVANVFVRPLASEEVHSLEFILPDQHTDDLDARTQAAILLGSNAGCTTSQIAAMLAVDESKVCRVITDANEQGFAGILAARRAEREHVIKTARDLDPEGFDANTREARPGKYEGASDLQLVVALDIINGHGFAAENTGDAAISGYAWRVNRFVGIEDSQGFVTAEEWPTPRHARERLRDLDALDVGDDSADEQEA